MKKRSLPHDWFYFLDEAVCVIKLAQHILSKSLIMLDSAGTLRGHHHHHHHLHQHHQLYSISTTFKRQHALVQPFMMLYSNLCWCAVKQSCNRISIIFICRLFSKNGQPFSEHGFTSNLSSPLLTSRSSCHWRVNVTRRWKGCGERF